MCVQRRDGLEHALAQPSAGKISAHFAGSGAVSRIGRVDIVVADTLELQTAIARCAHPFFGCPKINIGRFRLQILDIANANGQIQRLHFEALGNATPQIPFRAVRHHHVRIDEPD
ncbi:hypothetical protein [Paraburkholderia domus]|uniref:hypothetical protein n=1 Tax=Paraburkholderia domus TaxID=2793075 RepID=UPI001B8CB509|nr:hypothetical protein [Paraburkholderia domus]